MKELALGYIMLHFFIFLAPGAGAVLPVPIFPPAGYVEIIQYIFKLNAATLPSFSISLTCNQESSRGNPNLSFHASLLPHRYPRKSVLSDFHLITKDHWNLTLFSPSHPTCHCSIHCVICYCPFPPLDYKVSWIQEYRLLQHCTPRDLTGHSR